jgi:hypothetical protein
VKTTSQKHYLLSPGAGSLRTTVPTDHSRARCVPTPIASLRHIRRGEASACVCFSISSLIHTLSSAYRATYYLSRLPSTSTSNVRLNSCLPSCMNVPMRFIRNSIWVKPNNSNNPHQISKSYLGLLCTHYCLIY